MNECFFSRDKVLYSRAFLEIVTSSAVLNAFLDGTLSDLAFGAVFRQNRLVGRLASQTDPIRHGIGAFRKRARGLFEQRKFVRHRALVGGALAAVDPTIAKHGNPPSSYGMCNYIEDLNIVTQYHNAVPKSMRPNRGTQILRARNGEGDKNVKEVPG